MTSPPSTRKHCPVMKDAQSEAKNITAPVISVGDASRPIGVKPMIAFLISSFVSQLESVG